jgi:hypothetical protein
MILLYTLVLFVLGATKALLAWRAAALARKYGRVTASVERLTREAVLKDGNGSRHDVCRTAKRYFELGRQVQKKERLEARHFAWQTWNERVLDVWLLLYLIDYFGVGDYLSAHRVLDTVTAWLQR